MAHFPRCKYLNVNSEFRVFIAFSHPPSAACYSWSHFCPYLSVTPLWRSDHGNHSTNALAAFSSPSPSSPSESVTWATFQVHTLVRVFGSWNFYWQVCSPTSSIQYSLPGQVASFILQEVCNFVPHQIFNLFIYSFWQGMAGNFRSRARSIWYIAFNYLQALMNFKNQFSILWFEFKTTSAWL
jgi:hypothetical protein